MRMLEEFANFFGDVQHFLVQQIRFAIFGEKIAPDAAAQERQHFRARSEFGGQRMIAIPRGVGSAHSIISL